jgi:hypothetical protein
MERARGLYRETAEMARREGFPHVGLGYASQAAWTDALYGNDRLARQQAREILRDNPTDAVRLRTAAALALAGAPEEAERAIAPSKGVDMLLRKVYVPVAVATVRLARHQPAGALAALEDAEPYELGSVAAMAPVFLRGRARLQQGDGAAAARQFRSFSPPRRRPSRRSSRPASARAGLRRRAM